MSERRWTVNSYVKLRYAPRWVSNAVAISRVGGHNAGWDPLPDETWEALLPATRPHFSHARAWDAEPGAA